MMIIQDENRFKEQQQSRMSCTNEPISTENDQQQLNIADEPKIYPCDSFSKSNNRRKQNKPNRFDRRAKKRKILFSWPRIFSFSASPMTKNKILSTRRTTINFHRFEKKSIRLKLFNNRKTIRPKLIVNFVNVRSATNIFSKLIWPKNTDCWT